MQLKVWACHFLNLVPSASAIDSHGPVLRAHDQIAGVIGDGNVGPRMGPQQGPAAVRHLGRGSGAQDLKRNLMFRECLASAHAEHEHSQ